MKINKYDIYLNYLKNYCQNVKCAKCFSIRVSLYRNTHGHAPCGPRPLPTASLPSLLAPPPCFIMEWRSHAPSGRAHGTSTIEKYEWVSMERK